MGLSLADARDGEDRPPRPPFTAPALPAADMMAARCALRPGETADSGGSGPGLRGRRMVWIQGGEDE